MNPNNPRITVIKKTYDSFSIFPQIKVLPYLCQPDLEDEGPHLSQPGGATAEALEVVRGEHEEALLPPREKALALLPKEAPQEGRRGRGGRLWSLEKKELRLKHCYDTTSISLPVR